MVKEVRCRDTGMDCEFEMRSENEEEMVDLVQQHARNTHGKEMSRDDIQRGFREV